MSDSWVSPYQVVVNVVNICAISAAISYSYWTTRRMHLNRARMETKEIKEIKELNESKESYEKLHTQDRIVIEQLHNEIESLQASLVSNDKLSMTNDKDLLICRRMADSIVSKIAGVRVSVDTDHSVFCTERTEEKCAVCGEGVVAISHIFKTVDNYNSFAKSVMDTCGSIIDAHSELCNQ